MNQRLGLDYSKHNPISFIVSNRLVDMQRCYGSMKVLGSIMRLKVGRLNVKKNQIDRHMSNLELTYGSEIVSKMYSLIFGKVANLNRKVG